MTVNEYLRAYNRAQVHQVSHMDVFKASVGIQEPHEVCLECLRRGEIPPSARGSHYLKRRFSWAVPNDEALETIHRYSPHGVVEIGAGGGYWAMLLRERGVDVIAYDPQPGGGEWFTGSPWTEVLMGDHTSVIGHSDRTLLMVWPMYDAPWSHEAVELFEGDTIVYVGEGAGGCTGTDRFHARLGDTPYCSHYEELCTCDWPAPRFEQVTSVAIPHWFGLHDSLNVYQRKTA